MSNPPKETGSPDRDNHRPDPTQVPPGSDQPSDAGLAPHPVPHFIMDNPASGPASTQTDDSLGPHYDPTIAGPPAPQPKPAGQPRGSDALPGPSRPEPSPPAPPEPPAPPPGRLRP